MFKTDGYATSLPELSTIAYSMPVGIHKRRGCCNRYWKGAVTITLIFCLMTGYSYNISKIHAVYEVPNNRNRVHVTRTVPATTVDFDMATVTDVVRLSNLSFDDDLSISQIDDAVKELQNTANRTLGELSGQQREVVVKQDGEQPLLMVQPPNNGQQQIAGVWQLNNGRQPVAVVRPPDSGQQQAAEIQPPIIRQRPDAVIKPQNSGQQQAAEIQPQSNGQQQVAVVQLLNNGQQQVAEAELPKHGQQEFAAVQSPNNGQQEFAAVQSPNNGHPSAAGVQPPINGQPPAAGVQPAGNGQQPVTGVQLAGNGQQPVAEVQPVGNGQQPVAGVQPAGNGQQPVAGVQSPNNVQQVIVGVHPIDNGQQSVAGADVNGGYKQGPFTGDTQIGHIVHSNESLDVVDIKSTISSRHVSGDVPVQYRSLKNVGLSVHNSSDVSAEAASNAVSAVDSATHPEAPAAAKPEISQVDVSGHIAASLRNKSVEDVVKSADYSLVRGARSLAQRVLQNHSLGVYDNGPILDQTKDPVPLLMDKAGIKGSLGEFDNGFQSTTKPVTGTGDKMTSALTASTVDLSQLARKLSKFRKQDITVEQLKSSLRLSDKRPRKRKLKLMPDEYYAEPKLENLRLTSPANQTFVLIATYARSGSTWLGEITSKGDNSFYVYEPLFRIIVEGYYKKGVVCFNNDTCRWPRDVTEKHEFAVTSIQRLFTCQFTKLHPEILDNLRKNVKTAEAKAALRVCSKKYQKASRNYCIQELQTICEKSQTRIMKTIRLSMDLVSILLDVLPNLKVIHLIRDPRGLTNSRLNGPFKMTRQLYTHSLDTCNRIQEDVDYNRKLKHEYPDRITIVLYEALAERPYDGAEFIYKFLKIDVTWPVIYWVFNSTHARSDKTYYFASVRTDAVASAYRWRTEMKYSDVGTVDRVCTNLYSTLGLLKMESEEILRNMDLASRERVENFDGFI